MSEKAATILNVNDHEQTRYMVSRMLRIAGFDVIEAGSGEEALRLAASKPDLVILDIKLPDISGLEVCRMLKARSGSSLFVLQTSATFVSAERKVAGLDSGADGYLTHPFEPAELVATVNSLLRLKFAEEGLRQRADELVEADRRKDEFLAMLAHELRNPLSAITAALPLLEPSRDDIVRFREIRLVLERQAKHLARLVDDLLDVSRMTRGRIELRRTRCDLGATLAEAIASTRTSFAGRAQKLEVHIGEGAPLPVDGDCTRLLQVFVNLLDNASKYSDTGGRVRVTLSREPRPGGEFARVIVEDEGVGLADSFLPFVFDLFAQADQSLERSRGGMGIGLTLVKRLVEQHSGHVTARSAGLGKGSAFEVWLPLVDEAAAAADPATAGEAGGGTAALRSVLLIEDNADGAEMLRSLLEHHGHRVRIARDGITGVAMALTGEHEIGIIDIGLPGLNGYEVAAKIRDSSQGSAMALVALTGYGTKEQQQRAIGAGFDVHVVKPVNPEALLQIVASVRPGYR